ncbi:MAG: zinc ribbon domain-containing protein, partial [Anaerolineae bacterium]
MKCLKCGLENRPDARFCKQCGQSLPTQQAVSPTRPAPPPTICPACGATTKPHRIGTTRARFCPRCGKPLPTDPTQPSPSVADTIPAMSAIPQPYTTPPPATQPPTYTQPPLQPPPPLPPAAPARSFPRWAGWTVAIVVLICVVALVVAAITFGPKLLGGKEEPTTTPTATASLTAETSPTTSPTSVSEATPTPTTEVTLAFDA